MCEMLSRISAVFITNSKGLEGETLEMPFQVI